MTDVSAQIFFDALKYSNSVTTLNISKAKFSYEGFRQLALYIQTTKVLNSIFLYDLEYLGINVNLSIPKDRSRF